MFQLLHMEYILPEYLSVIRIFVFCLSLPPALSLAVDGDLGHLCIFLCVLRVIEVSVKGSHSRLISGEVIFVRVIISNAPVAVYWELANIRASLVSAQVQLLCWSMLSATPALQVRVVTTCSFVRFLLLLRISGSHILLHVIFAHRDL